jgi:hypothetical protein
MVRRVAVDGAPVAATAAAFGYSRPSYYQAAAALAESGLDGLVPARPRPRGGHKLTGQILDWAEAQLVAQALLTGWRTPLHSPEAYNVMTAHTPAPGPLPRRRRCSPPVMERVHRW